MRPLQLNQLRFFEFLEENKALTLWLFYFSHLNIGLSKFFKSTGNPDYIIRVMLTPTFKTRDQATFEKLHEIWTK